jgi:hypothetical protein
MSVTFGDAPKSILQPPGTSSGKPRPSPAEARRIALTHASTLQIRKALELSVLDSLTYLLDLPSASPPPAASAPSKEDIALFKHHLRYFTPADYDSLLTERNIADCCGYVLCPQPPKRAAVKSRYTRLGSKWVPREETERFCSPECARRALWIRVQLSEEPAWTRADVAAGATVDENTGEVSGVDLDSERGTGGQWIRLLEEEVGGTVGSAREEDVWRLEEDLRGVGITGVGDVGKGKRKAMEGQTGVDVVERNEETGVIEPPTEGELEAIEGYTPRMRKGSLGQAEDL